MADDIYSMLEQADPSAEDKTAALGAALRGRNAQLRQKQFLGNYISGLNPQMGNSIATQAGQEQEQGLSGLEKLRQLAIQKTSEERQLQALQANMGNMQAQRTLDAARLAEQSTQHKAENAIKGSEVNLKIEELKHTLSKEQAEKVKDLGKELSPHAELYANLRHIGDLLKKHPDAPGVGPGAGLIPTPFEPAEAQDLRKSIEQLSLQYDKATGGAKAINPEMLSRLTGATGLNTRGTVTGIMQGLQAMKRNADADVAAKAGAYDPAVQDAYFKRVKGIPRPGAGEGKSSKPLDHDAAAKWLQANPNDPNAPAVRAALEKAKAMATK